MWFGKHELVGWVGGTARETVHNKNTAAVPGYLVVAVWCNVMSRVQKVQGWLRQWFSS